MIDLLISGVSGRMGQRVQRCASDDARFRIAATTSSVGLQQHITNASIHAVIDFSTDAGAADACQRALEHSAALLVATTGLSEPTMQRLKQAATAIAVIIAPNTSFGIAVVDNLLITLPRLLQDRFSVDIVESHHRRKRDRPSGTALRLARTIEANSDMRIDAERVHSIRGGDIIGDHELIFASDEEVIRISHSALNRDVFARGALNAITWLVHQKPGLYSIQQAWGIDIDKAPAK